jgi:hypothetical protein
MIELSTRTKATYTYVKDWMMLRECVAGCLGSLQSVSHQNAKLKPKAHLPNSSKSVERSKSQSAPPVAMLKPHWVICASATGEVS